MNFRLVESVRIGDGDDEMDLLAAPMYTILLVIHRLIETINHPSCTDHILWPDEFSTDSDFHTFSRIRCICNSFFLQ